MPVQEATSLPPWVVTTMVILQALMSLVCGQEGADFMSGRSGNVYVGGSYHTHGGSGANVQCLSGQDIMEGDYDTSDTGGGIIYHAEYETSGLLNSWFDDLHDSEVGRCTDYSSEPLSLDCTAYHIASTNNGYNSDSLCGLSRSAQSHTLQYQGYIFTAHTGHQRLEAICMDANAESTGSRGNENGMLLYPTEAYGLGGYTNNREVTCPSGHTRLDYGPMAGTYYSFAKWSIKLQMQASHLISIRSMITRLAVGSVCQAPDTRTVSMVQYGRTTCPSGWTQDYRGYIMASRYNMRRTTWICIDETPDIYGSKTSNDGGLLYFTEYHDTYPSSYTRYREMTCVRCSKTTSSGSVYPMVGSTSCASGDSRIYYGTWAGAHYSHSGGGFNGMCLHSSPSWLTYNQNAHNGGRVYRAEYQYGEMTDVAYDRLQDRDVPCAMCLRSNPDSFMYPARNTCPQGYKVDFQGILTSEKHDHNKGAFYCVKQNPSYTGSTGNEDGYLLYPVEIQSGNGRIFDWATPFYELPCTMCSGPAPPPPPPPPDSATGPTFVRWGRWDCPSSASIVYQGRGAGAHYTHSGGGPNFQCMPQDVSPIPGAWTQEGNSRSILYAMEYQTSGFPFLSDLHDSDARSYTCPTGFSTLYTGYLFASKYDQYRTEHICVDKDAQSIGSTRNEDGALIYPVEGVGVSGYTDYAEVRETALRLQASSAGPSPL
ncbi:uncharacterized protein MONBRDRAFT_30605, partial [Monosiga brevicollis MX1]